LATSDFFSSKYGNFAKKIIKKKTFIPFTLNLLSRSLFFFPPTLCEILLEKKKKKKKKQQQQHIAYTPST
jgi:hypothetical protein